MGIGEAIALALAKEGVNLALLSRSKVLSAFNFQLFVVGEC